MPELDGTMQRRIATLERRVENLARTSERSRAVLGNTRAVQQVRTAKTWSDDPLTYPSTGNTFGIIFQDIAVALPTSPGSRTVTRTDRTTLVEDYATSLDGAYLPRGSYVAVIYQAGHWWIIGSIRENEGLVSYKEWIITYQGNSSAFPPAPVNTITGYASYAISVDDVIESGDAGVSWDDGAHNWEVTRDGVIDVFVEIEFTPYFFEKRFTYEEPAAGDRTNYRDSKHTILTLHIDRSTGVAVNRDDRGDSDFFFRDNFSMREPAYHDAGRLVARCPCDVLIGDRITTWVGGRERINGLDTTPTFVKQETIFHARLGVLRMNDSPAVVAMPGPLTYYRFDDSDNTRVTEDGVDDRITE